MILLPKEPILEGLAAEFAAIDGLVAGLEPAEWDAMTPCPEWDVRANLAHIVGTESTLAGVSAPDIGVDPTSLPHVRNDIGALNERWVQGLSSLPVDELIARYRGITSERLESLRTMTQDDWDAEGFTPAGRDSYGRFMRIRIFDCWMHEQDMRDAIGRHGHQAGPVVELVLDEMVAVLGYVVGKKAGAPKGSSVTFELTGDATRTVHVEVGDRAAVAAALDGPATVTLRMPVGVFTRLGGGRVSPADVAGEVAISGDDALGRAIVDNFAYTI